MNMFAGKFGLQNFWFRMTLNTDIVFHIPFAKNDVKMTLLTGDLAVQVILVDKWQVFVGVDVDFSLGLRVTQLAVCHFRMLVLFIEMAGKAGGFSYRQMLALNDL